jgi:hypothetical protein
MSGLFIAMFAARRGLRGQSLTIVVAKCLGTRAATVLYGVVFHDALYLGIACGALDVVHIDLCRRAKWKGPAVAPTPGDRTITGNAADPVPPA